MSAALPTASDAPLLELRDLQTHFFTPGGVMKAVQGVTLTVNRREVVAIVGESGCGKSVTAFSILKLIPDPPGRIVGGQVLFEGRDLASLSEQEMRAVHGDGISMIFQEPMTSLNPVLTIGEQIIEGILQHRSIGREAARERAVELLGLVHISDPARRVGQYPHELSGGMRQRVMIAMALACEPRLLIADEPTTALDVTVQAQILDLLTEMRDRFGMGVILITHDLGVVAETADRVVVMYAGRKIEEAPVADLFRRPLHPYTQGLIRATPEPGRRERLTEIPGMVPALNDMPPGCTFAPRCPFAIEACREVLPPLDEHEPGHWAACIRVPVTLDAPVDARLEAAQ